MRRWPTLLVAAGLLMAALPAGAEERPLKVVATLSTFADLVTTVGGERVEAAAIAPPAFNPHFIEPKPSDVLKVKRAELLVHGGLDLELWRGPLLDAAGNRRVMPGGDGELDLSRGLTLLEVPDRMPSRAEGDIHLFGNPHFWLDPENSRLMTQAIAEKLAAIDPAHADMFQRNARLFQERLEAKTAEWRRLLASVQGRELVGYHNEWPYFVQFAGLRMEHFLEPKPGIPPTPGQISFLEGYMRRQAITVIVQPSYQPAGAAEQLARRTGARVVTLCQSVKELKPCGDYVAMMDYNVRQLVDALSG